MPIVTMKEALAHAETHNYALGAFNCTNLNVLSGILDAAEESRSPVILSFAEVHFEYMDFELMMAAAYRAAQRTNIPVVLHLDHGVTMGAIMQAIRYGASSVMMDASTQSLHKNIKSVQKVVEICKPLNISVEGELGHVGGGEGDGSEHIVDDTAFTKVDEALEYVQKTGIDSLAVAVGNIHGRYKGKPNLQFDLISQIKSVVKIPLVLHGGSGISDLDFQHAISKGIRKINFYTGNFLEANKELISFANQDPYTKGIDIGKFWKLSREAFYRQTLHNMHVFMSVGKADIS